MALRFFDEGPMLLWTTTDTVVVLSYRIFAFDIAVIFKFLARKIVLAPASHLSLISRASREGRSFPCLGQSDIRRVQLEQQANVAQPSREHSLPTQIHNLLLPILLLTISS